MAESLKYRRVTPKEIAAAHKLEAEGYHPDEAASYDSLLYRQRHAGEFFLGAFDSDNRLVGFVTSTLADSPLVTEQSMREHNPRGKNLCIHSVCTAHDMQRKGVALTLLRQLIAELRRKNAEPREMGLPPVYERVTLIARPYLVPLYEKAGFRSLGKSSVAHGPDPWIDCILTL
ncbi:hypothetical protein EV182_000479 [Spiromyces aspiralis]|uniref:Uncharacterized protein n=1 Tax=Spiromyces aspiralis TaxID=68401 RepID=A0ACC1HWR5_9FUNG|nr:hypothetical protein EV182_000479 [Spiromyces aspiralis]